MKNHLIVNGNYCFRGIKKIYSVLSSPRMFVLRLKKYPFGIGSLLFKPVEHILRYPLLLEKLLKLTEIPEEMVDTSCYSDLMNAVKQIRDVADELNEEKRKMDIGNSLLRWIFCIHHPAESWDILPVLFYFEKFHNSAFSNSDQILPIAHKMFWWNKQVLLHNTKGKS